MFASVTVIGAAVIAACLHGSIAASVAVSREVQQRSGISVVSSVFATGSGVVFANTSSVSNSAQSGEVSVTVRVIGALGDGNTRPSAFTVPTLTSIIGPFV